MKVPQFRPQAALAFCKKFVQGDMLAPLLPSNKTLAAMNDDDFEIAMDAWTETAMGPPFVYPYQEEEPEKDTVVVTPIVASAAA